MSKLLSKITTNLSWVYKILLILIAIILILVLFPKTNTFKYEYQKGSVWKQNDLYAPFNFPILKSEAEIDKEKKEMRSEQILYCYIDTATVHTKRQALEILFQQSYPSDSKALKLKSNKAQLHNFIFSVFDTLMQVGILETPQGKINSETKVILIQNNIGREYTIADFLSIQEASNLIDQRVGKLPKISEQNLALNLLKESLIQNIRLDQNRTNIEYKARLSQFSATRGMVSAGQLIITKGEIISPEKYQTLYSLEKESIGKYDTNFSKRNLLIGQFLLLTISFFALFLFLKLIKHPIFYDNKKIIFILLLIVMMVAVTAMIIKFNPDYLFLTPLCLAPIIISVFFDTRVALYIYLVTIIIIGFLVPNSFEFIFYQLIAGMMAIISVENLERRSKFFIVSLVIFFTYSFIYFAMTLVQDTNLENIELSRFMVFAGNALITLLAFPLIYIFERMFGFVSEISLMELSNNGTKALRELANKAPGTFQHSVQVANIAEDIVHEIGGNALLARVGGLYHDIGKTIEPMYFIENQTTGLNPHDALTYEESAGIIVGHVINGVELGYKYKLPEPIIDFIRTHHGTGRPNYFYHKQKEKYPDLPINEDAFSYAGPRPYSKETAVVMIVDSVEAASRSLKVRTEDNINALVDSIVDRLIREDQFSNSDITFRDINKIKELLKKKLMSIFHVRIEYPLNN